MTVTGLDFAWDKPTAAQIKAAGYSFVCRYLSYDNTGKNLTKAEALSYQKAGIHVVSNWEYSTTAALNGRSQGIADATEANRQHLACGGGASDPIYFSADWDATPGQQSAIDSYLRGAASVLGAARVGVYGSYYVVKRCYENGSAKWLWQTYAWSGGQLYSNAHIYQYNNGFKLNGHDTDQNKALKTNYGQWGQNGVTDMALTDKVQLATWVQDAFADIKASKGVMTLNTAVGSGYGHARVARAELEDPTSGLKAQAANQKATDAKVDTLTKTVADFVKTGGTQVQVDAVTVASELAKNDTFIQKLADALVGRNK